MLVQPHWDRLSGRHGLVVPWPPREGGWGHALRRAPPSPCLELRHELPSPRSSLPTACGRAADPFKPHGCRSKRSFSSSASCACSPVFHTGRRPPTLFRPSAPCLLEAPQVGLLPGLPRSPSSHSPAPSSTWCPVLLGPPSVALPSQLSSCRYRGFCGAFLVGFWEVVTPGRLGAGGLAQKM